MAGHALAESQGNVPQQCRYADRRGIEDCISYADAQSSTRKSCVNFRFYALFSPDSSLVFMPKLVSERIKKLREEIRDQKRTARICTGEMEGQPPNKNGGQRLQEILDELMTLTDWKK